MDFMKKFVLSLVVLSLIAAFLAACGGSTGSSSSSSSSGSSSSGMPTVHMNGNNFAQSSITISKGQSLMLVDDASAVHIIANGSWSNGSAQPKQESGAPAVNNLQFNGNDSHTIGPFNTAGTYHLFCTVHPGMNLSVIVP
jgi:plastocyanin